MECYLGSMGIMYSRIIPETLIIFRGFTEVVVLLYYMLYKFSNDVPATYVSMNVMNILSQASRPYYRMEHIEKKLVGLIQVRIPAYSPCSEENIKTSHIILV